MLETIPLFTRALVDVMSRNIDGKRGVREQQTRLQSGLIMRPELAIGLPDVPTGFDPRFIGIGRSWNVKSTVPVYDQVRIG